MTLPITALYAGIFAIFALFLSYQAGSFRGKSGISILHGEPVNWQLALLVRRHQNFVENVPIILILMGLIEINGGPAVFLHSAGILLIVARIAHAMGLKHDNIRHIGRAIGAGGTALITLAAAGYALWIAVTALT